MNAILHSPPFSKSHQLCKDLDEAGQQTVTSLPGQPCLMPNDSLHIKQFLEKEFCAQDLEALVPRLWIMSTQSGANINPLHRQLVKGRNIIVTEEPRLHLVWFHDRIFIKPLPKYLLSYRFWEMFLVDKSSSLGDLRETIRKAAMGYLRTYRYLIQHESDFVIAQQDHLRLVPLDVKWTEFCRFISTFDHIKDVDVSGRYSYGELRLSRLNFYAPFLLGKFHFEQIHGQYGDYFARLYGPILFVFAVATTILNSMQVVLAVEQVSTMHWVKLYSVARWFSVIMLVGAAMITLSFVLLWSWMFLDEWVYAIKSKRRKRQGEPFKC